MERNNHFLPNSINRTESSQDCIFCKIIRGEAPASKIHESARTITIAARENGYPLILTKKHLTNLLDPNFDEETAAELGILQRKFAKIVGILPEVEGVTIVNTNGKAGGQEIMHLHYHIIPRRRRDGLITIRRGFTLSAQELNESAELYKSKLEGLDLPPYQNC